jgi:hypothetical protein
LKAVFADVRSLSEKASPGGAARSSPSPATAASARRPTPDSRGSAPPIPSRESPRWRLGSPARADPSSTRQPSAPPVRRGTMARY